MNDESNGNRIADAPGTAIVVVAAVVLLAPLVVLIVTRLRAEPDPAGFEREIERARAALSAKRPRDSLVPLARAARLRPDAFAVHNNYCVAYGLMKRRNEAVSACRRALQIEPANVLARNNLAWVESIEKDSEP
jgi:Flp pilus assembly protein TadD